MTPGWSLPQLVLDEEPRAGSELADPTGARVEVWALDDGRVFGYLGSRDGQHWVDLPELASFHFDDRGGRVRAVRHSAVPADVVLDSYRRWVMPLVLQALGLEVLHASAVVTPSGVVALCGESGTGKSTLAYALSRRGFPIWADDAVAFELSEGAIATRRLPFELRLRSKSASFFGFAPAVTRLRLKPDPMPGAGPASQPVAAICVLSRARTADDLARFERLGPSTAFRAVLPHAHCFSLGDRERKRRMVERYLAMVLKVPIFEARLPSTLDRLAATVDRLQSVLLQGASLAEP